MPALDKDMDRETRETFRKIPALRAGVYRHYKGKRYLLLGVASHSETGEIVVVYVPLYETPGTNMAVRPLSMWLEKVKVPGKTKKVPRFQFVQLFA